MSSSGEDSVYGSMKSWQENTKYHIQDRDAKDASSGGELMVNGEVIFGSQLLKENSGTITKMKKASRFQSTVSLQ